MNSRDRTAWALAAALAVSAFIFFAHPPSPRYYPIEHAWKMEKEPDAPSMGWYGRSAWFLGSGAAVGAAAWLLLGFIGRRENEGRRPASSWLPALIAGAALLACLAAVVHHERHRLFGG